MHKFILVITSFVLLINIQVQANENKFDHEVIKVEYEKERAKAQRSITSHGPQNEKKAHTLSEIVKLTREKNYSIRKESEKVYRARHNIKVSIGRLLPSLNIGNVLSTVEMNYFDLIPSLIGFIFPSNWFRWKESNSLYQAEKYSYSALIANQINAIESQYYQVHLFKMLTIFYQNYISELEEIISKVRIRVSIGETLFDALARLENILIMAKQNKLLIEKTTKEHYFNLSFTIGLSYKDWDAFEIAPYELPTLNNQMYKNPADYEALLVDRSLELKQIKYMIIGSKYHRRSRIFEFLTPGGSTDSSLGFGYPSYIKIGRSKTRELQIIQEEINGNLHVALEKALLNYNNSIDYYIDAQVGLKNSNMLVRFIFDKFTHGGVFESEELVNAFQEKLIFNTQILEAQHKFLIASAQFNRLLYNGPFYENILKIRPSQDQGKCK